MSKRNPQACYSLADHAETLVEELNSVEPLAQIQKDFLEIWQERLEGAFNHALNMAKASDHQKQVARLVFEKGYLTTEEINDLYPF